jgi:hypothetical protein
MSLIVEDVVVGGVQQWKLVRHEDFQNGAEGWSVAKTSSCGGKDFFLGGHCNAGHGEIFKTFNNLPAHTQVGRAWEPGLVYLSCLVCICVCIVFLVSLFFLCVCGSVCGSVGLSVSLSVNL